MLKVKQQITTVKSLRGRHPVMTEEQCATCEEALRLRRKVIATISYSTAYSYRKLVNVEISNYPQ